ncbi:hypothetical protein [Devosia sp.]|uniref:hypothetical protein n=1 Tax=Devosia sp. TaxID=1871048 RepID=UPI00342E6E04
MLNLLRNASEAMIGVDDRPRQLLVRTERKNGDCVEVTVRDAGVGLDGQSMDKLLITLYDKERPGAAAAAAVSASPLRPARHR